MSKLLVIALLLLPLMDHGTYLATAWDDQDFFKYCPPSQCSQHGPTIRYPFCPDSGNTSSSCGCSGTGGLILACSGQATILVHPVLGPYNVSAIDYRSCSMKLIPLVDPCLVLQQKLISFRSSSSRQVHVAYDEPQDVFYFWRSSATLVCCSREFTPAAADSIAGPVSCLSNTTHILYLVDGNEDMSILPLDCKVVPFSDDNGILIPKYMSDDQMSDNFSESRYFKESAERILSFAETTVYWTARYCLPCEADDAVRSAHNGIDNSACLTLLV